MPIQHITELFAFDGRAFVTEAYRYLLGREPDENGLRYYLGRLAIGYSKGAVLAQLARSPECRPHDEIKGLDKLIADERRSNHWFWGLFSHSSKSKVGKTSHALLAQLGSEFSRIDQSLATLQDTVLNQAQQISSLVEQVAQTQETLKNSLEIARLQFQRPNHAVNARAALGRSNSRFIFNLTTSHHWRSHPVGIVRVERELAKYLTAYENVKFVLWDSAGGVLRALDRWHVNNILSDRWCDSNDKSVSHYHAASLPELELSSSDTFVSVGLDWDHSPVHEIAKYLNKCGAKMVGACYDIVPILFPEFCVRQGLDQEFRRHFVDLAHAATRVCAISDNSRRDLIRFWIDADIETRFPQVNVIPLGAAERGRNLPELNMSEADTLQHTLSCGDYVLYVSTLEARKNHRLLVNIWKELHRERGRACPRLIFVGMRGWGIDDLLNQIGRMHVFKDDKVTWLEGVSDALLAHLYAHCMFTVFPSMYEGWGLAATEALSYGKVCVIANNSSLPQAVQGLMPNFHPLDYFGWKDEISRLIDDQEYRYEVEQKITTEYKHRTWEDFAREFCEQLLIQM
jgi:glycosyltransferase involved in cell wall biosynthesis